MRGPGGRYDPVLARAGLDYQPDEMTLTLALGHWSRAVDEQRVRGLPPLGVPGAALGAYCQHTTTATITVPVGPAREGESEDRARRRALNRARWQLAQQALVADLALIGPWSAATSPDGGELHVTCRARPFIVATRPEET